jgi:drug/metabolite transporter (DMT)-like permease
VAAAAGEAGRARTLLLGLTVVWASTFVVVHTAVGLVSPFVLVASRFAVAGVAIAIASPRTLRAGWRLIGPAMGLSLSMLAGFGLQTTGLATTTPARSAFLTSLSVIFVPVLDMFDTHRLPRWRLLAAAALAATGVFALFHPIGGEWHHGDSLTLASAGVFAYYVVALDRQSRKHAALPLVMAQCLTIGALAGLAAPFVAPRFVVAPGSFLVVGYLGIVCTAMTFALMTWGQARVSAVEAAIIYTLEPVVAAIISIGVGREPFSWKLPLGGTLVVAAMLFASTDPTEPHPVAPPEGID